MLTPRCCRVIVTVAGDRLVVAVPLVHGVERGKEGVVPAAGVPGIVGDRVTGIQLEEQTLTMLPEEKSIAGPIGDCGDPDGAIVVDHTVEMPQDRRWHEVRVAEGESSRIATVAGKCLEPVARGQGEYCVDATNVNQVEAPARGYSRRGT